MANVKSYSEAGGGAEVGGAGADMGGGAEVGGGLSPTQRDLSDALEGLQRYILSSPEYPPGSDSEEIFE